MAARKKTIAGELVTRIGEEHSGFHLLGDCDFNDKNIYGPLNIVNDQGERVAVIDTNGLLTIAQIIVNGLTASKGVYTNGSKQLTSTPPSSGILGHWSRTGTTISPSNAGDNISTTGTLTSPTVADHPHQDVNTTAKPSFLDPTSAQHAATKAYVDTEIDTDISTHTAITTAHHTKTVSSDIVHDNTSGVHQDVNTEAGPSFDTLTITAPTQDYTFSARDTPGTTLVWRAEDGNFVVDMFSGDGVGTQQVLFQFFGYAQPDQFTNRFQLQFGFNPSPDDAYIFSSISAGDPSSKKMIFRVDGKGFILEVDGSINYLGDGSGPPYGAMGQENEPTTVTINSSGTAEIVGGQEGGETNNVIFQNSQELRILKAGRYLITWALSFNMTSGSGQEVEGAIGKGGVAQSQGSAHRKIGTANDTGAMCGNTILDLAVNNLITIMVTNETSTVNVVIAHASLSLMQVGGT